MKNYISYLRPLQFPSFLLFLSCLLIPNLLKAQLDSIGWKANVAKINITPKAPMWMAGFASRTKPSQGVIHPIWSKALVIQDKDKNTAVLITNDLSGMPRDMSTRIKKKIKTRYGLNEDAVLLNFSHSHSGPVLKDYLYHVYPLSDDEIDKVNTYSDWLEDQIVELVGQALKGLIPAKIFTENGLTRFQVNRRNNTEAELGATTTTNGPNDYAVPVLKVTDRKDNIMAVAFGYACHATVLSATQWSGDYPGFAQVALEKMYPGATAMFFQGAGANQNPLPRRSIPLAKKYGKELAVAVENVLNEEMKPLASTLKTTYAEVNLELNAPLPMRFWKK